MPEKGTRIRTIGGLIGPLDVNDVRQVRIALNEWLDKNSKSEESKIQKRATSVGKAVDYFKHVIDTGQTY